LYSLLHCPINTFASVNVVNISPLSNSSLSLPLIDYLVEVAGIDHVGLGSDFDGGVFFPKNLKDVGDFPNITLELVRRGYSA